MILTIRTDKPEAEVGLYEPDGKQVDYFTWHAHRELSVTLLSTIRDQLAKRHMAFSNLTGIVVFRGPGSFTGLRIGITVANTMAYSMQIPVVGTMGDSWQRDGVQSVAAGHNDQIVMPAYGAEANITLPRK